MCEKTYRRLLFLLLAGIVCLLYGSLPVNRNKNIKSQETSPSLAVNKEDVRYVYPSGEPIGIYVKTDGVMVIGVTAVQGERGERLSPCEGKIMQGDYIMAIDEKNICSKKEMIEQVQESEGAMLDITLKRDGKILTEKIKPIMGINHKYLIGLWVKDDISGIGTMTYETEHGFGALGHSINDNDTGELFHISDGAVYKADIINIRRPSEGIPGRLEGVIDYTRDNMVGRVEDNEEYGIQGELVSLGKNNLRDQEDMVEVAKKIDVHVGDAYLMSAITGKKELYEIQVIALNLDRNDSKGILIKVVDENLIKLTGGIVQGMSGSPILQDGKLIGAVTHVFVNDATKGYGIFIEDMLE